jgi:hypothetical protein
MTRRCREVSSPACDAIHPPDGAVTYTWAYLDEAGEEVGRSAAFPEREAAEDWMGQAWQDLLERGIEQVALEDGEARVRLGVPRRPTSTTPARLAVLEEGALR